MQSNFHRTLLSKNLNDLPLSAPENSWLFDGKSESLTKALRVTAQEWLRQQENQKCRDISISHASIDDILPKDLIQHTFSFLPVGNNDIRQPYFAQELKRVIPLAHVNKQWNDLCLDRERYLYDMHNTFDDNAKDVESLSRYFLRLKPERVMRGVTPLVLSAISIAVEKDPSIYITSIGGNDYFHCLDPSVRQHRELYSIREYELVDSTVIIQYFEKLRDLYRGRENENFLEYMHVAYELDENCTKMIGLLPQSLRNFPIPVGKKRGCNLDSDVWLSSILSTRLEVVYLDNIWGEGLGFGMLSLRCLSEKMKNLECVQVSIAEGTDVNEVRGVFEDIFRENVRLDTVDLIFPHPDAVDVDFWRNMALPERCQHYKVRILGENKDTIRIFDPLLLG